MIKIDAVQKDQGTEMAVIILCCRVFFNTATKDELKVFVKSNSIDWIKFLNLSIMHGIRPIVYKIIHQVEVDIPLKIKSIITANHMEITMIQLKLAFETERIILLLKENNITAIPYKGIAFSKQFFGNLISRESSDIDLIINPKDLSQAIKILKNDAYIPEHEQVYEHLDTKYFSYFKDYTFNKYEDNTKEFHLELHWGITNYFYCVDLKVNELFINPKGSVELVKEKVMALDYTAHFSSILVHHSISDTFNCLRNIIDISQAICHPEIKKSGHSLEKSFTNLKLKRVLALSNILSQKLLGVSLEGVGDYKPNERVVKHFLDQLCSKHVTHLKRLNRFKWLKNSIFLQDTFLRRFKCYWLFYKYRFIPTQADFKIITIPKQFFFLYFFIKPFRDLVNLIKDENY